jgi:CRISPR-associated protein Csb2
MPFSITVRLRHGRYDAGGDRPSEAEWPPHPARVFCALAAAADGDPAWSALRWLEAQPAPEVWADPDDQVRTGGAAAYVVKNATHPKGGGNLSWPGRDNGLRTRAFAVPASAAFTVVWPQADPPAGVLAQLRCLARLVPYVGRSSSLAEVSVAASEPGNLDGRVVYEMAQLGDPQADYQVRIPYPGYTQELQAAYLDGRRSWEVARTVPYAVRQPRAARADGDSDPTLVEGPFEDLMVWTLARPVARINGDQAVALASALRNAVMSRIPDPIPAQVSGHGAPGRPHVGFLALPDVGHDHADGHILGLALAIPRDLPPADLGTLVRAVIMDPLTRLRLPGGRSLTLQYGADRSGLQPARWAARSRGGTREWVTVTPLMLDGHLRRGRDESSEVARSLVVAGYPRPADVEVSAAPLVGGGVWRPRPDTLPAGRPRRRLVHARVVFAEPMAGPVLAGSMRYLGLGLFLPAPSAAARRHVRTADEHGRSGGQPGGPAGLPQPAEVAR